MSFKFRMKTNEIITMRRLRSSPVTIATLSGQHPKRWGPTGSAITQFTLHPKMQSRPRVIVLAYLCVLIGVNCADAISSDSILIKRVLAANQPPADASGSSVSVGSDNDTVLRAQDAENHRDKPTNGGGSSRCKTGSSTTTTTSTPDIMVGDPPSVDPAASSNRNSMVRRSARTYGLIKTRSRCDECEVWYKGKCRCVKCK